MDEEADEDLYRNAAQLLLEYDEDMVAEYSGFGIPDARQTARKLYERHGPFKLVFKGDQPVWYNG